MYRLYDILEGILIRTYRSNNVLGEILISRTYRFNDPLLPRPGVLPGPAEQPGVLGEDEGAWEEAELLLPKASSHLRQVPPETVLPPDLKGAGEVVQLEHKRNTTE